jgi:hypothetical protein
MGGGTRAGLKKESWSRVSSARPLYQKFGFSDVGSGETVSHRKLLSSKAMAVNVAEKSERDFGRYD